MTVFIVIVNDEVDSVWDSYYLALKRRNENLWAGARIVERKMNNG